MAFASTLNSPSVNIMWCVNFGVVKLRVVKWGFMIKFYLEVSPTFVESLFKTFGASTMLEGRQFQMSTIRIDKYHFLMLKSACCTNNLKLCPLVVEKLLFDRKSTTMYILKPFPEFLLKQTP